MITPTGTARVSEDVLPPALALAFAPLHKRAFGTAVGTAAGLTFFFVTLVHVLTDPRGGLPLGLLAEYFYGYSVTGIGAFIGLAWGMAIGFVAGWFFAFCRNLALAISIFVSRTRGELESTRDFLDHI
ncbi:MAG: hypothetical protein H7Z74_04285 [Anaerolineae bacterium]|nr:hypothetical protein [Gemmatimonadaceae bacterium]